MVYKKSLRSKRQKRRFLKRKNAKSRKVMRGGGLHPDPLIEVKVGDTVTVTMSDIKGGVVNNPMVRAGDMCQNISIDCKVLSVQESVQGTQPKKVTLKLPDNSRFMLSNNKNKKEQLWGLEFNITLNTDGESYSFLTYENLGDGRKNYYNYIIKKNNAMHSQDVPWYLVNVSLNPTASL